jgi:hypothetical protein
MTLGRSRRDTVIPVSGSQPDRIPPRAALGQNGRCSERSAAGTWKAKAVIEKNENENVR